MTKEIKAFACEFCGKLYYVKKVCERHESICFKSPNQGKICMNCKNLNLGTYGRDEEFEPRSCAKSGDKFASNKTLGKIRHKRFKISKKSILEPKEIAALKPFPIYCEKFECRYGLATGKQEEK